MPAPADAARPVVHSQHFPALDGLRGVAILVVILHNSGHFGPVTGVVWLIALLAAVGWVGVQLFFVLSGFLITSNLLDSQNAPNYYRVFFARRTLRIFPLYYAALLVGLVIVPLAFPAAAIDGPPQADQLWLWTFLFNWAHPFGTAAYGFPHFWSLAVEEQFYLIWPFVVHRRVPRKLLKLCMWIALAALAIRVALRVGGADPELVYEYTVCRMDALAIGASIAAMVRMPELMPRLRAFAAWLLPAACALGLLGALTTWAFTRDYFFTQTYGQTILALTFGALVLAAVIDVGKANLGWQKILSNAVLRSIGKYSYGMYVLHFPINLMMEDVTTQLRAQFGVGQPIVYFLLETAVTYVAALVAYHALEKHFLRLKRHFVPAPVAPARESAPTHA